MNKYNLTFKNKKINNKYFIKNNIVWANTMIKVFLITIIIYIA